MGKASTYQRRARDYAQKADWDAALAELRHATAKDPGNPMLQNQMGDLFLRKEEVTQACQHFEKAIELYASLGLHNNAVALCRKVIRLCPSRLEVRYQLACLRHEQGLRSEASAFFADYFDHLPMDGDDSIRLLEDRSTEVVEHYPDAAPVGRILEKLEDARAFACAFSLVQGLAQRATDAGDDEAARRYTTKMRSLRVLVESHGGDLPAPAAEAEDSSSPGPDRQGEALSPPADPRGETSWMEPSAVFDPPSLEVPESIELEARKPAAAAPGRQEADDGHAVSATNEDAAGDSPSSAADSPPVLEMLDPEEAAAEDVEVLDSESEDEADPPVQEYEIPETSLEEVASLFEIDGFEAAAPEPQAGEASGTEFEVAEPLPELTVEPVESVSEARDDTAANFAGSASRRGEPPASEVGRSHLGTSDATESTAPPLPEPEEQPPETAGFVEEGAPVSVHPNEAMQEIIPPQTTPRWKMPSRNAGPRMDPQLLDPVWVPEGEWNDSNREPWPEAGSIHELAEVIDTFRTQMARALGDDAAARYDLGVAYYEMGLYNEALSEFEAAQPHEALRERSLEMMAACMAMQGRHAEILDLLAPALEGPAAPERVLGLRYSMGVACEALGRRDEARQHFEVVARIDSGYRDVRTRLQMR